MSALLRFNDLACLDQSTMGVGSAGLAVVARAGFSTSRGFAVTPETFSEFLKKDRVAEALAAYRAGSGDRKTQTEMLRAAFRNERIQWGDEMDLIVGFRELDGAVSVTATTRLGMDNREFYAHNENGFLEAIKDCWLRWLLDQEDSLETGIVPALLVRHIPEAEVSVELRKRGGGIHTRAVYGLPGGLGDPSVSPDIYEFDETGELVRLEQREQEWQYILGKHGPVRTAVAEEFQGEEKATGEMLATLGDLMAMMHKAVKMERCMVCFVGDKPVIYSALLIPESTNVVVTLPAREHSLNLMAVDEEETAGPMDAPVHPKDAPPVIATKLFLNIKDAADLDAVTDLRVDGIFLTRKLVEEYLDDFEELTRTVMEANRRLGMARVAVDAGAMGVVPDSLLKPLQDLKEAGLEVSILLSGSRSLNELGNTIGSAKHDLGRLGLECWLPVRYPSNMFFMDALAENADLLALDLERFSRLLLGTVDEDVGWLNFSLPVLRNAFSELIDNARELDKRLAVLSPDLVGSPSLLEFLIRKGVEIICVEPQDLPTIRHIVASIEKRMLLERRVGQQ